MHLRLSAVTSNAITGFHWVIAVERLDAGPTHVCVNY